MLTICLLTLGDPGRMTGGYLYHRRMADAAAGHNAQVLFGSFPIYPVPLPALRAATVVRGVRAIGADVVLVDSIAAAYLAPWLATHRLDRPLAASIHQPPGGIDHGPIRTHAQAVLDRATYRRSGRLLVANALGMGVLDTAERAGCSSRATIWPRRSSPAGSPIDRCASWRPGGTWPPRPRDRPLTSGAAGGLRCSSSGTG